MSDYTRYLLYSAGFNLTDQEVEEIDRSGHPYALVQALSSLQQDSLIEIAGHMFPLTLDRLYAAEYLAQGKRYPKPRKQKSKVWRERMRKKRGK